ncbi:SDR family oxidoreductase [Nocardia rhamnosiphila]|uniref:SDR family NAD(P)-dependent oxidoreductase n=1 Tax=Nocardia rhamnosiphila TaxID=426716 RepID=UPI0033E3A007
MKQIPIPDIPDLRFAGLADQTIVVVGGAGGGVGTACVSLLARNGAHVLLVDRDGAAARQVASRIAGSIAVVVADVATDGGIELLRTTLQQVRPSGFIHVVGGVKTGEVAHFLDITAEQWRQSIETNLTCAMQAGQATAQRMAETGQPGAIVNLSVADARFAMPWFAPYGAARAGLEALTRTMAVELGPLRIRANCVCWGLIDSPRAHAGARSDGSAEHDLIPLGRRGTVGEVAATALFLLSDASAYITGQSISVDGGLTLRLSHYGPRHNLPEFLESEPERTRLAADAHRWHGDLGP